ncbi:MAG: molybdenum cofactor guanylyltransferase MobA [Ottowia sp.]|uniref:molybdenum cofactor guanylyltransferase MobA n=1 Tax=Ottowia sp. TaxID=1898956 RepID=UPI003C7181EE
MSISREDITGLVLAGGPGTRKGGADRGLQNHHGIPLALHALLRVQPQVGATMISANRNLSAYESMGVPVWPDSIEGYIGPLAGLLTGLEHAETAWLVTVPCDAPGLPDDLVERLAQAAAAQGADIAVAAVNDHGQLLAQPTFCLLRMELVESLVAFLHAGGREFDQWSSQHRTVLVPFEESAAF